MLEIVCCQSQSVVYTFNMSPLHYNVFPKVPRAVNQKQISSNVTVDDGEMLRKVKGKKYDN